MTWKQDIDRLKRLGDYRRCRMGTGMTWNDRIRIENDLKWQNSNWEWVEVTEYNLGMTWNDRSRIGKDLTGQNVNWEWLEVTEYELGMTWSDRIRIGNDLHWWERLERKTEHRVLWVLLRGKRMKEKTILSYAGLATTEGEARVKVKKRKKHAHAR